MAQVRLVVSIDAAPGKGAEFAKVFAERCKESRKDAGCQHFEIFQSVDNPDKFALLELWESQEALNAHAKLNQSRPPLRTTSVAPRIDWPAYSNEKLPCFSRRAPGPLAAQNACDAGDASTTRPDASSSR